MKQSLNFTEGKIFSPLIRFALPVLLALFLQTMYGAADLMIVGQFGISADVSAVSTGSMVMQTVTGIITSLATGLTVLVGRKIGEGYKQEAGDIIGSGICLFGVLTVVISAVMVFAATPIASAMQAPEEAFDRTVSYITICSLGAVFITAYNLVGSIFRGIGDSVMPLVTVAIACAFNIAGDLLLVGVFHMGTTGAAIATVAAQMLSVVLSLLIIRRKPLPFTFHIRSIRPSAVHIRRILLLGVPIALQELLVSMSFLVITSIVNELGLTASAGVGIGEKRCGFIMLVSYAYMQSMSAFVAQNIGANKPERANKALLYGILSSVAVGIVMAYLVFFHGDVLSGIFCNDPEVIVAAAEYLKAYAFDCLLTAFLFCFIGYFNGIGKTVFVMLQGIVGAFLVRIPISWFVSRQAAATLFHIGLATPAASLVQILMCGVYLALIIRKQKRL